MPALVLALVAVLGFGFVALLFALARIAPPHRVDGDIVTLRHGPLLRGFAITAFFGAPLLLGLWIALFPPRSNATLLPVILTTALLALLGVLLVWEAFQFELTIAPTGLTGRSPWKGRFAQPWANLKAVRYSRGNAWFALAFADGGTFHVSALVPGVVRLLEACERHLPPEALAGAQPGYRMVRRPWPPVK
jgi:hypothetical protein